jgi:L-lactate dehydrogenase complex protein LldF
VYDFLLQLGAVGQKILPQKEGMINRLPPPMSGWTVSRDIKPIAAQSFIDRWRKGL